MIGIGGMLYVTKFLHVNSTFHGFPTRVLFAVSVALAAAPLLVTIVQRVPVVYLIPPLFVIFFIYPLFSPYGLPYSRDAIYNFQFAQALLNTHTWRPGLDVTNQAIVYSYFPGAAVFNSEVSAFTGLPVVGTFLWSQVLLRFLVVPALVYALCLRLFGIRAAALGVLLYVTVASIEMNVPTQQDFGVIFVLLTLAALVLLWGADPADSPGLRVVVVAASIFVVFSHHISSYVLAILLAGIALLPWIFRRRDMYPSLRATTVFARYAVLLVLFTSIVVYPIAGRLVAYGRLNLSDVLRSSSHFSVAVGATFPLYQTVWIGVSVALIVVFSILTLVLTWRVDRLALVTFSVLAALITAVIAIPFVSTGFSFLALRLMEYAGIILCGAAAWWLVSRLAGRAERRDPGPVHRDLRRFRREARVSGITAMAVAFVIVAGGSMVPLSTRDQFAAPSSVLIDSPVNINQSAYQGALWAKNNLNHSELVWGDEFVYSTIGGFGHFQVAYNSWPLFNGPGFNSAEILNQTATACRLTVGEYVVLDTFTTKEAWIPPVYPGMEQPAWGVNISSPATLGIYLGKFLNNTAFTSIYQDSVFTILQVSTSVCPTLVS